MVKGLKEYDALDVRVCLHAFLLAGLLDRTIIIGLVIDSMADRYCPNLFENSGVKTRGYYQLGHESNSSMSTS